MKRRVIVFAAALLLTTGLSAQKYKGGLVDKTVAVVGNEVILVSDIESEVQQMQAQGRSSDRDVRCNLLENMMESKIFLMQARIDSLSVNYDMVDGELSNRIDQFRTYLGGDEELIGEILRQTPVQAAPGVAADVRGPEPHPGRTAPDRG